jgi:hypothetical protein
MGMLLLIMLQSSTSQPFLTSDQIFILFVAHFFFSSMILSSLGIFAVHLRISRGKHIVKHSPALENAFSQLFPKGRSKWRRKK